MSPLIPEKEYRDREYIDSRNQDWISHTVNYLCLLWTDCHESDFLRLFSSEKLTGLRARLGALLNLPKVMSPVRLLDRWSFTFSWKHPKLLYSSFATFNCGHGEYELDICNQLGGNIKPILFLWQHTPFFDRLCYCSIAKKLNLVQ